VAAVALAELTGATRSLRGTTLAPGFAVEQPGRTNRATTVSGKATVQHLRSGETTTLPYKAHARSPLELTCRAGKDTVTLAGLPDEAREPIALAVLARLVNAPTVSAKDCRRALALARASDGAGSGTSAFFHPVFADLLPRLLEQLPASDADDETVAIVAEMLAAVPETTRGEAHKRAQEWAWHGLIAGGAKGKPSPALRGFAEKLSLAVDDILGDLRRGR
jgi:hypothetical protein